MNNLISSFSLREELRIFLPGLYTTIMLKNIAFYVIFRRSVNLDQVDGWVIFVVLSVIFGGLLYSLDIPRWFRKLYSTLPSNLIEQSLGDNKAHDKEKSREIENKYLKFYYKMDPDVKFTTEIYTGFFHFYMTMSFIGLLFTFVYCIFITCDQLIALYRILNVSVFLVCLVSAFVMYKQKLKYSWKKGYELYIESQRSNPKVSD